MMRTWSLPALFTLCGLLVATGLVLSGSPGEAAALLLMFLLLAGMHSSLVFPSSMSAPEAQRRSAVDGQADRLLASGV